MKAIIIFFILTNVLYSYNLQLNIEPSDSKVEINNKQISDSKINLSEGEYQIKVCKANYNCYNKKLWVIDSDIELKIKLTPKESVLTITSDNSGSTVYINDKKTEKGEVIKFQEPQTINIKEKKDYYSENNLKFKIEMGQTYHLNLPRLKAIKKLLIVRGDFPEVSIRLNGREICNTNCKKSVDAGKYHLSIIKNGYYPYEKDISITDKDVLIDYKLNKIPATLTFGAGISYLYGRLLGGYPELNFELKFKNKVTFKGDLIYVVNFSNDSEYYGIVLGASYNVLRHKEILDIYTGIDLIFSKYIDNTVDYLENGVGLNVGASFKIIDNLHITTELINRLHYNYNDDFYDILGKFGLIYYF